MMAKLLDNAPPYVGETSIHLNIAHIVHMYAHTHTHTPGFHLENRAGGDSTYEKMGGGGGGGGGAQ